MIRPADHPIQRYLRTGDDEDVLHHWAGENALVSAALGHAAMLDALIADLRTRTAEAIVPTGRGDLDIAALTRSKVAPMVIGLFPPNERAAVLDILGRAVVVLTPETIGAVLGGMRWLSTAWNLANLYLAGVDAPLLSDAAPRLVGLSEETTCYVGANFCRDERRFDDFVVHECAHIFHNSKRESIGLRKKRDAEWLLEIDFSKRETFAYACEAYSRILALGSGRRARTMLLAELHQAPTPADDRVDRDEYLDIVREAVAARNGWQRILQRCAPSKQGRAPSNRSTDNVEATLADADSSD